MYIHCLILVTVANSVHILVIWMHNSFLYATESIYNDNDVSMPCAQWPTRTRGNTHAYFLKISFLKNNYDKLTLYLRIKWFQRQSSSDYSKSTLLVVYTYYFICSWIMFRSFYLLLLYTWFIEEFHELWSISDTDIYH